MKSLKSIMYGGPNFDGQPREVRYSYFKAESWEALCGRNSQLERFAIGTENALTCFPRDMEEDATIKGRLSDLFKDQAHTACIQVEILVAMKYLQKAKLEAFVTKDNWAKDMLGRVDEGIVKLIQCHDILVENY
jgi:hypothetical protein